MSLSLSFPHGHCCRTCLACVLSLFPSPLVGQSKSFGTVSIFSSDRIAQEPKASCCKRELRWLQPFLKNEPMPFCCAGAALLFLALLPPAFGCGVDEEEDEVRETGG